MAIGILEDHARRYADYALVVADRVGFDVDAGSVPVVLAGSVLAAPDSPLAAAVRTALAARFPVGSVRPAQMSPVAGAALDALAESGVSATPPVIATLTEALHSE